MCKQILQNLCNSSAMKYSADCVWVLAHKTWAAKYFMGRAPSDEIKDKPQGGAGCAADAFMNAEG